MDDEAAATVDLEAGAVSREDLWPELRRALAATDVIWRCGGCGYQRWSRGRPSVCPTCQGEAEAFEGFSAIEWRRRMVGDPLLVEQGGDG
jgi:rubrerythrin